MIDIKTNNWRAMPKQNVYLNGVTERGGGSVLFFDAQSGTITLNSSSRGVYVNSSDQLIYWNGTTSTVLGSSGSIVSYSLDDAYDDGATINVDGSAVTFAGSHATNNVFAITYAGSGTGNMIDIQNDSSGTAGYDIIGTDDSWYVDSAGAALLTGITGCDTIVAAANLSLNATGTGTIAIGDVSTGAVTITPALTAVASITITGSADTTVLAVTDGDMTIGGSITITEDDTATYGLNIASSGTTGGGIYVTADDLANGYAVVIDSDNGASFGTGGYFSCYNGSGTDFKIARYGAVTVTGNAAGTASITLTAGDFVVTDGYVSVTCTGTTGANVIDVVAASLTTKNIFHCDDADGLTTGSIAYFVSDSSDTTARPLVYVKNDNVAAVGAIALSLANDSTSTTAFIDHNGVTGKALYIDAESTTQTDGIIDIAPTAMTTGTVIDIGDINAVTTGKGIYMASTSAVATSADFLAIAHTASSATLAARTGSAIDITSSLENKKTSATLAHDYDLVTISRVDIQNGAGGTTTSAGSALKVLHTATQTAGTLTDTAYGIELQVTGSATSAALFINSDHNGGSILVDDEATTGTVVDLSLQALTEGKGIDMSDLDAITSGKGIHIDATGNTQTTGILLHLDSASGVIATTGRIFYSAHTGTAGTSAVLNEFTSAATDETTVLRVGASAALAAGVILDVSGAAMTTGTALDMSNLSAITTGKGLHIDASGTTQTSGILAHIDSAGTAITGAGRLLLVDHTGATTTSGTLVEFKTSATDETILAEFDAASLTSGTIINVVPTALTTGSALKIEGADALTSGDLVSIESDSADTSARALLKMHNNNSAAVGCVPLEIVQDAVISTNFKMVLELAGTTIYVSDGTTPNGNLSGSEGDLCLNGGSGAAFICTGTTNWTTLV